MSSCGVNAAESPVAHPGLAIQKKGVECMSRGRLLVTGVVLLMLAFGGAAQGPSGAGIPLLGPFPVTTDDEGYFLARPEMLRGVGVEGWAQDAGTGEPLRQRELELYLEPAPGKDEIRGPWDIGGVVIVDPTGEFSLTWASPLNVTVDFRAGAFLSLVPVGQVSLARPQPCPSCEYKVLITGEDRRVVQFHYWYCQDGVWQYQRWVRAIKVFVGPPEGPELGEGQWVVVVSEGAAGRTYRFFGVAEGEEPLEIGHTVPVGEALPLGPCQPCEHFLVEEADTRLLYHCDAAGQWKLVREWQPPEEGPPTGPPEEAPPPEGEEPPPPPPPS